MHASALTLERLVAKGRPSPIRIHGARGCVVVERQEQSAMPWRMIRDQEPVNGRVTGAGRDKNAPSCEKAGDGTAFGRLD